jgi:hypothetical protein
MPETQESPKEPQTPQELMASIANAPSPEQIAAWKSQAPNGNIYGFSPDAKRVYILRGLTGVEMRQFDKDLPETTPDRDFEFQAAALSAACLWTNSTRSTKLEPATLRAATFGIVPTLWQVVEQLSDHFPPAQVMAMVFDL